MIWPCKDGHVLFFLAGGAAHGVVTSSSKMVQMANEDGMILGLKEYDWSNYNSATIPQEERNEMEKPFAEYLLTKTV